MNDYVHFTREDNIHLVARFAFLENCVTGFKWDEELGISKKMAELHADYSYAQYDKFQVGFWRESADPVLGRWAWRIGIEFLRWRSNYRNLVYRCPVIHAQ